MDKDQLEQPPRHYNLRSSLKRQSRNPGGSLDVTDKGQDATLQPQPRRVSFAASRNVKPFLDDSDNNTVWDHTYDEPIISNTDSNNVPSLDSQGNVQETIGDDGKMHRTLFESDMDFTCGNIQETIGNNGGGQKTLFEAEMDFTCLPTNSTQYMEVDMSLTRIEQKENIHSIILNPKNKKSLKTKPLGTNASLMEPTIEGFTFVESLNEKNEGQYTKYADLTKHQEVDMSLTCKFNNDLIIHQEVDMSLTCKFNNALIIQSVQEHIHKADNICGSNDKEETNCSSDVEQKEEISIPIHKLDLEKNYCPEKFEVQQTESTVKYSVESGCEDNTCAKPFKTILEPNHGANHTLSKVSPEKQTLQENVISKAMPAIFVDSGNDISLEPKIHAAEKTTNKQMPFGQIYIAADISMEESKTKVGQPLNKLTPIPTTSVHEATRMDNLTLGEPYKESINQNSENETLQENVISTATPAIFVDSANDISIEPKSISETKAKNKRIPLGQIHISADISMEESKTKVGQPLNKLTAITTTSVHEATRMDNLTLGEPHKESMNQRPENISTISKATPEMFVDSANDVGLEPKSLSEKKPKNKRIPLSKIHIAAASNMKESEAEVGQTQDKLTSVPTASKSILENITLQENSISKVSSFKTPAIFVDSANELCEEHESLAVGKTKDKQISFGHISIAADSSVEQRKTTVEQPQDKLTSTSESIIHGALNLPCTNIETNIDEELSIVDLHDRDCTNILTPPKVIYTEPMPAKPSTSFLNFTTGLSSLTLTSKKKFSNSTLDGTQQLIEATFSKPHRNESEVFEIDNSNALDSLPTIAQFKPAKFNYERAFKLIRESQDLQEEVGRYFEQESANPKLQKSVLNEKVKRLSLCSNLSRDQSHDQSTYDGVFLEDLLLDTSVLETSKSIHEKIMDIFQNNRRHIIELHTFQENGYICSTFSNLVWFSVKLHTEDGTVQGMMVSAAIKVDNSKSAWPALYNLVAGCIINKLQMDNLKSALGANFDMLSLLDYVIMVTERSLEFFVKFIETRLHMKTLDVSDDGTISFTIYLTDPTTIWAIAFRMASVETIQQDSLVATSKWGTINQENLRTILKNTEPGIDCIKRFADAVLLYFKRTLNVLENIKMV